MQTFQCEIKFRFFRLIFAEKNLLSQKKTFHQSRKLFCNVPMQNQFPVFSAALAEKNFPLKKKPFTRVESRKNFPPNERLLPVSSIFNAYAKNMDYARTTFAA